MSQKGAVLRPSMDAKIQENGSNSSCSPHDTNSSTQRQQQRQEVTSPFYFLTAEAAQAIPNYQYKGEDRSLLYRYALSPLAQFLVDHTPNNIAPNTITFAGLCSMVFGYLIFWYYVPNLQIQNVEEIPRWIFLYNAIAMLIYQTLDNMDGKQARKTKSSSPLGLLFDHGCDAINSIFGSANWIVAMGLNPMEDAWLCYIVVVGPYALFYIATWEEYYTGELILPLFNGPNEGLFGGAMLSITSYMYGSDWWLSQSIWSNFLLPMLSSMKLIPADYLDSLRWRNADLMVMLACLGFVQEVVSKSTSVIGTYGFQAFCDVLPFCAVSLATFVIGYCDETIFQKNPRTSLHLIACLLVEMVTELMKAHISAQKFEPLQRWINLPLFFLATVVLGADLLGQETPAWTNDYLIIYATAACTYFGMKLVIVIDEICRVLTIWCFDIVTPRPASMSFTRHKKLQ